MRCLLPLALSASHHRKLIEMQSEVHSKPGEETSFFSPSFHFAILIFLFVLALGARLYAIYRYHRQPSLALLVVAGVVCGLSILVKMVGIFALFATFFALHLHRHGFKKTVFNGHLTMFVVRLKGQLCTW